MIDEWGRATLAANAGKDPQQAVQLEQWRDREPAVQQIVRADLEPDHATDVTPIYVTLVSPVGGDTTYVA